MYREAYSLEICCMQKDTKEIKDVQDIKVYLSIIIWLVPQYYPFNTFKTFHKSLFEEFPRILESDRN